MFILHLEISHIETISVVRYEIIKNTMTVICKKLKQIPEQALCPEEQAFFTEPRLADNLRLIASKIEKKTQKTSKVYYHSGDIFKTVGP